MSEKAQAKVVVRAIQVTAPGEVTPSSLFVQLWIDCPECGITEGALSGHHLRAVHRALGMIIDANPEFCGDAGEAATQTRFTGTSTPGKETLN